VPDVYTSGSSYQRAFEQDQGKPGPKRAIAIFQSDVARPQVFEGCHERSQPGSGVRYPAQRMGCTSSSQRSSSSGLMITVLFIFSTSLHQEMRQDQPGFAELKLF